MLPPNSKYTAKNAAMRQGNFDYKSDVISVGCYKTTKTDEILALISCIFYKEDIYCMR